MSLKSIILPAGVLLTLALVRYLNINVNLNIIGRQEGFGDCAKLVNLVRSYPIKSPYQNKAIGRSGFEDCAKLVDLNILSCCSVMDFQWPSEEYLKAIDECREINDDNSQCQPDMCVAERWNMLSTDGTGLNETALVDFVMDRYDPEFQLNYMMTCVHGDLAYYDDTAGKTLCLVIQMRRCLVAQTIIGCKEFDTSRNPTLCSDVESLVSSCSSMFPTSGFSI